MHTTNIAELQHWSRWLGRLFTGIAALMTFSFGFALGGDSLFASALIGTGLAAVTVLVAILLNFVDAAATSGARTVAIGLGAFWCVCVATEYFSHVGFTVGHRSSNVQHAVHQDNRHDDARKTVADLERQLQRLQARHDWTKTAEPHTAYDERIKTAQAAVDLEASRGGCKDKCIARKSELATLTALRATAIDRETVAEEIKTVQASLDKARASAGATAKGDSPVYNQTAMAAQLITGSLRPTETALHWAGVSIGAFISLVFTFASAVCNFIGFRDWRISSTPRAPSLPESPARPLRTVDTFSKYLREQCQAHGVQAPRLAA